jgi:hypothetical protein
MGDTSTDSTQPIEPTGSTRVTTPRCPVCGEPYRAGDRECGVCGSPLTTTSATAGTIVVVLILVCVGTGLVLPGVGVLLAIASIAQIVRLSMLVRRRTELGLETPHWQQWALFGSSLFVTCTILLTTGVVAFFTFCFSCLGAMELTGWRGGMEAGLLVATLVTLIVVGLLVWAYSKWVRKRWERDVHRRE